MKVIGFVGSPRQGGNTDVLVTQALRGALSEGAEVEICYLAKLDISPCQACEECRSIKHCQLDDDMQNVYELLLSADAIILGTPIYFWGPSAQLKAFLDRWFALDQPGIRERLHGKRCLLICAFADSDPATAGATVEMIRSATSWLEMEFIEPLLATAWERGEIAHNAAVMQRAYALGAQLGG